MFELAESALLALGGFLMIITTILAISPILPGVIMTWGVAIAVAVLTNFSRVTPAAAIVMTVLMIIGITADFWLPLFGVKTSGLTCLSAIGSFVGGIIGTFFIPVPIFGTLIGSVIGAVGIDLLIFRDARKAARAGTTTVKLYVVGSVVELVICVAILILYGISVVTTA